MEYKNFIKPGEKVIHIPTEVSDSLWWYEPQVVTIGEYRPYYTDGTPDPTPEEYDEICYVEIEEETDYGETQLPLGSLLQIFREEKTVIYDGERHTTYGHDEDDDYCVLFKNDSDELFVVDSDDVCEERNIGDLSHEELVTLRKEICLGSMYLSDFRNSLGIERDAALIFSEEYSDYLEDEYGEEWEAHDTPEEFANYFMATA